MDIWCDPKANSTMLWKGSRIGLLPIFSSARMLIHKPTSMHMSRWTWTHDQEQIFLKYFIHPELFFDAYNRIFVDVEEYFAMCPWMNDSYGLKNGWI